MRKRGLAPMPGTVFESTVHVFELSKVIYVPYNMWPLSSSIQILGDFVWPRHTWIQIKRTCNQCVWRSYMHMVNIHYNEGPTFQRRLLPPSSGRSVEEQKPLKSGELLPDMAPQSRWLPVLRTWNLTSRSTVFLDEQTANREVMTFSLESLFCATLMRYTPSKPVT